MSDSTDVTEVDAARLDALINEGLRHTDEGDFRAALSVHRQIVALDPQADRFADLSEVALEAEAIDEANAAATKSVELDPDGDKAYVIQAELARRAGDLDACDLLLRKGVRRGAVIPDDHIFLIYRVWAESLIADGDTPRAHEVIASAAAFFSAHPRLRLLAAGLAERIADVPAALQHYKRALDDLPRGPLRTDVLEKIASLI